MAVISLRMTYEWLARYRAGGLCATSCSERLINGDCNMPLSCGIKRCTLRRIARMLLVNLSTVGRAMSAICFGRLRNLPPNPLCSDINGKSQGT
jgi:hypothetical protein